MATNLYITRARTNVFNIYATQSGAAFNLTGATIRMTAKWSFTDADGSAVFALHSGAGIATTDAANGLATATIPATATTSLPLTPVQLFYDIQVTDASNNVWQVADGLIYVTPNVTITTP